METTDRITQKYDKKLMVRLFHQEYYKIKQIVTHARLNETERKYINSSHFIRCAIIKLINSEYPGIQIKRGRLLKAENRIKKT